MQSLENKTVIITGGSKGIGRVLAIRLANEKSKIVITGRNAKDLEHTVNEIKNTGHVDIIGIKADVSVYEDVKQVINQTIQNYRCIDILVNNAGIFPHKLLRDFTVDDWKKVVEVNLFGPMMMCKEALPYMEKLAKTTGASVVNIASTSGKRGYEKGTAYTASKFALTGFSESLFKEVREHNIRVITVYPSYVETDIIEENKQKQIGKGVYMRAEDVADSIISALKLPQRAMLKEIEVWGTNP
jgi:3-oxoacyl-[acyl-carrier protein] reductase